MTPLLLLLARMRASHDIAFIDINDWMKASRLRLNAFKTQGDVVGH